MSEHPGHGVVRVQGQPHLSLGKARAHIGETPYEVTINVGRHGPFGPSRLRNLLWAT